MIRQEELFNRIEGQQLRDKGIELAMNADRVTIWKAKAEAWLEKGRYDHRFEFTSDDLVYAIGLPATGSNQNNVVGAIIRSWASHGRIQETGRYRTSSRTARHAGLLRVWKKP